jgi:hypothetical protein
LISILLPRIYSILSSLRRRPASFRLCQA